MVKGKIKKPLRKPVKKVKGKAKSKVQEVKGRNLIRVKPAGVKRRRTTEGKRAKPVGSLLGGVSLLSAAITEKIVRAIVIGNSPEKAAVLAGVGASTYYLWLRKGREDKSGKYRVFAGEIEGASAQMENRFISYVHRMAQKDGYLALKFLGKKNQLEYGDHAHLTISGPGGGPVQVEMTTEKAREILGNIIEPDYEVELLDDEGVVE